MAESTYTAPATYTITFPSLSQSEVKVSIDGVLQSSGFTISGYATSGSGTVSFASAPASGAIVRIFRDTTILSNQLPAPKSDFQPGASIKAEDLNVNMDQVLYKLAEKIDDGDISNDAIVTQGIRDLNVTTAKIADSSVTTAKIADANVTTAKIADSNVTTAKIADSNVTTSKIANANVTTAKIADSNVTTAKINDAAVTTAKIADSAVTSAKIVDGTIVNADINASAAISGSKLADSSVDLDKIVDADVVVTSGYSTNWASDDTKIATVGSLAARHDLVVNTDVNPPSTAQTGKQWLSTAPGNQVHKIYDGSGWRTVAVGQPYSPATTTVVRYVDVTNGSDASDVTGFLPQAPLQSIGRALTLVNASGTGDGTLIKVAPGVYQEPLPLRIKKNNISIVGESLRSCFVHPTVATENNDMFEVDSGSYISNLTLLGLKVPTSDQGSRNNSLDNDATYGLPSNQPFSVRFRTDVQPIILKSPYIQNCTHFSDAHFDNANFDPNTFPSTDGQTYSAVAGDQTSAPCGGGVVIDGAAVSSSSPIRSMVVDAFTQITLDGPGILVTNNGYAQLVSFFGTFAHYHAKAKNGGQINLSNCVSDFGRYGLIADGKSPSAIATATASAANSGATTITIGAISTAGSFHGTVSRPLDHMMVTIDGVDYGVVSSTANGSGWNIVLTSGLTSNITNTTVNFALRSYISTGGHTFEFVGVGTDYGDHPDNGGVPVEANQVIELNGGKVWQSSTDHVGKFKAGNVLVVNQVSETVDLKATTVTGNLAVTGTVDGRDVAADGTKLDGVETGAEVNVNADWNASSGDAQILNKPTIPAAYTNSNVDTHLNQSSAATNEVLSWNGSDYDWVAQSAGGGGTMSNVVEDTTPQLGGNLDVNGKDIVSVSNGDIDLDPNGSGVVVFKGNSTKGSGQFKLNCEQNSHGITIKGPAHSAAASYTLTLPTTDGSADEVLKTDGSGNLSWVASGGASEINDLTDGKTVSSGASLGLGNNALSSYTGSGSNVAIGKSALEDLVSGSNNVAVGVDAAANTTGSSNVAIGAESLKTNVDGLGCVAIGMRALRDNTSAIFNNALGMFALLSTTTGEENVALGTRALQANTTANHNTAVGCYSLRYNTTGGQNTAIGLQALEDCTTGSNNVAFGYEAGKDITNGAANVFVGVGAGSSTGTSVTANTLIGRRAGQNTTANYQVALGYQALQNGTGTNAIAIGNNSGRSAAGNTIYIGYEAGFSGTGTENVCIGRQAGYGGSGGGNTFIGSEAQTGSTTGSNNICIGRESGLSSSSVSNEITLGNVNITSLRIPGLQSGATNGQVLTYNSTNGNITLAAGGLTDNSTNAASIGIGPNALNSETSGNGNVALGDEALTDLSSGDNNIAIGRNAGDSVTTGDENVLIGYRTGQALTTTYGTTAVGFSAARQLTSGSDTTAVGYQALEDCTSGNRNSAFGYRVLEDLTTGSSNTCIGMYCGTEVTTGSSNTAVGDLSLYKATTGGYNVVVGYAALEDTTTGSYNTALGWNAGHQNTTNSASTYVGGLAGNKIAGAQNTAVGYNALKGDTNSASAQRNVAVGVDAGENITTGNNNVLLGWRAGQDTSTGSNRIIIGYDSDASSATVDNEITLGNASITSLRIPGLQSGASNGQVLTYNSTNGNITFADAGGGGASALNDLSDVTYDSSNQKLAVGALSEVNDAYSTSLGYAAGRNYNGQKSVAIGNYALGGGAGGASGYNDNTAVGYFAGYSVGDGERNTYFGSVAGQSNTSANNNTYIGYAAGKNATNSSQSVILGYEAGGELTTGNNNTFVGVNAGAQTTTGASNVAIGRYARVGNGTHNVCIGLSLMNAATTGSQNIAIGYQGLSSLTSGQYNTVVGYQAGKSVTTGASNTLLGHYAGYNVTTGGNNTVIGDQTTASSATATNEVTLGNSSISTLRCNTQTISSLSDGRDKTEVEDLPLGLDFIDTLRPVKFKWDTRDGNGKDGSYDAGFIAQDLQSAQSTSNADYLKMVMDENPDRLEAAYGQLIPVLVQAIKDLSTQVKQLQTA